MIQSGRPITILIAEDDIEDQMLVEDAFEESRLRGDLHFVSDGVELMEYLHQQGRFADPDVAPRPGLVLLDLNMPRKDGREALEEVKTDPRLRTIPVVVLTTSRAEADILKSYELGSNSFVTKPVTFEGLVQVVKGLAAYWFEMVELPPVPAGENPAAGP